MTDFAHELRRRILIEEPLVDHDAEIGRGIRMDLDDTTVTPEEAARIAAVVHEDRTNPLAATAIARPALELVLDMPAVLAKFPQEENRG